MMPDPNRTGPPTPDHPEAEGVQTAASIRTLLARVRTVSRREWLTLLRADQHDRWRRGERVLVEVYLDGMPELQADGEAAVDLIFSEVLLRQAHGEQPVPGEYYGRFPQHRDRLERQFALCDALAASSLQLTSDQLSSDAGLRTRAPLPSAQAPMAGCIVQATPGVSAAEAPIDDCVAAFRQADITHQGAATEKDADPPRPIASVGPPSVPGYEILGELGRGGMGIVYHALHLHLNRPVALKFIKDGLFAEPEQIRRFHREAQAAAKLSHRNIVTVFDAGQNGNIHYLVLEYVEGITLANLVRQRGPLPAATACEYVRQAAEGLQHAFERGMVHRDIKPANLMLMPDGQVKILDFGLARWASESEAISCLTEKNAILGTLDYLAPEQARDAHGADIRADIYSLGCTLYHLLTGHPPFHAKKSIEKLAAHLEQSPEPISLHDDVPEALPSVLARMMAKDPARRYQAPSEVAHALAQLAGPSPAHAVSGHWSRSRRRLALVAGLAAASLLSAVVLRLVLRDPTPRNTEPVDSPTAFAIRTLEGHTGWVYGVTFSPDGTKALSCSGEPTKRALPADPDTGLRLWDIERGEQLGWLRTEGEAVLCVVFNADGRRAVSGGRKGDMRVWDVEERKEIVRYKDLHKDEVHAVACSPDGRRALSGSYDRTMLLWEIETGAVVKRFQGRSGKGEAHDGQTVQYVALSLDGRRALSGGGDATIKLWNVDTGEELWQRPADTPRSKYVACVALSPDGRHAVSSGSSGDNVQLWDVQSGNPIRRFEGHKAIVWSVVFSADGRRLLTASWDGTVRLWDVKTGEELACLTGHEKSVYRAVFSADSRRALSSGQDGTVRLWRLPE